MSMEGDLRELLEGLGHPVVWGSFKDNVGFPRISLQRISNLTGYTLKGRSQNETARVQVNLYAETSGALIRLAPQVSRLLTEYRGGSVIRCKEQSRCKCWIFRCAIAPDPWPGNRQFQKTERNV